MIEGKYLTLANTESEMFLLESNWPSPDAGSEPREPWSAKLAMSWKVELSTPCDDS